MAQHFEFVCVCGEGGRCPWVIYAYECVSAKPTAVLWFIRMLDMSIWKPVALGTAALRCACVRPPALLLFPNLREGSKQFFSGVGGVLK